MFAFEAVKFLLDAEGGALTSHNAIMFSLLSRVFDFPRVLLLYETEVQRTQTWNLAATRSEQAPKITMHLNEAMALFH